MKDNYALAQEAINMYVQMGEVLIESGKKGLAPEASTIALMSSGAQLAQAHAVLALIDEIRKT